MAQMKEQNKTPEKELNKTETANLSPVRWADTGSEGREDLRQGSDWWTGQTHIPLQINQEEQLGRETNHATQGSSAVKIKPEKLWM